MKSSFVTTRTVAWSEPKVINLNSTISLGIFGDSFGASANDMIFDQWWPTKLANKLNVKTYTNYCRGATSLYFAYTNFLRHYKENDINIVLLTNVNRYSKSTYLPSANPKSSDFTITNINSLIDIRKTYANKLSEADSKSLDYLEGWFIATDDQYMKDMQMLMINQMRTLDPNVILIPCFGDSASETILQELGLSKEQNLHEVVRMQHKSLGSKKNINIISDYIERPEAICCHFTPEFNNQVVDVVLERINTGKWNWKFTENIKHEHTLEHYYEQRTI